MLSKRGEQTVVLIDALTGERSGTLWLTMTEWRELIATVDRLIVQDNKVLTEAGRDTPAPIPDATGIAA